MNMWTAPTNDAFAALPEGTVDSLLLPENLEKLQEILKYHVVSANANSASLSSGEVPTLSGDSVMIDLSDGVKVNDASVVTADIIASNGIIHVIDSVLLPPDDEEAPAEAEDTTDMEDTDMEETSTSAPTKMPTTASGAATYGSVLALTIAAAAIFA